RWVGGGGGGGGGGVSGGVVFFQAEDGIRDWSVTGVQTCALPILSSSCNASNAFDALQLELSIAADTLATTGRARFERLRLAEARSEERRVGKEWRSRGWAEP